MRQIRTYEGFFDFFKKVDIEVLADECRRILSNKEGLSEVKTMNGFEWEFKETFEGESLDFDIWLRTSGGGFLLNVRCEDPEEDDILDYISFMKDGKDLLKDLEFHITYNIEKCGKKVLNLMKSKDFFLDHPEDEIRDYIVDLGDTLGDTIQLSEDYQRIGWQMQFHISRDSNNFDSVKNEIDEQVRVLSSLLDSVNLQLVDLEQKLDSTRKGTGQKVYGHYRFLIKKK